MQEETIGILYQRKQNFWSKTAIYTLKVLPNRTKQITKSHALQVQMVVETGWSKRRKSK